MDSNRRHQLSQNDLANWIITQYEEWLEPNSKWIGVVALVVLALLAVFLGSAKVIEWNKATAWNQYFQAVQSPNAEETLEAMADVTKGPIGDQARLSLAQITVGEASNFILSDKPKAIGMLEKAIEQFGRVISTTSDVNILRQASYGIAQAWETLAAMRTDKNDLAEAQKAYKAVAERWPNDFFGKQAQKQWDLISRPDTKKFFEQLAAKVVETPKAEDFKVDIDPNDPFKGMDATKALGESSILGGAFTDAAGTAATEEKASDAEAPSAVKSVEETKDEEK